MNDNKTLSMLHRMPVILAVTAASYGLPVQAAQLASQRSAVKDAISRPAAAQPIQQRRVVRQR
ncbi:hypothetical protein [Ramlibacter sp.]|uniref:hypothetical protein n=1 Tax=Ramlibacter sp. TaxID=1917967 RepID=UPI002C3A0EEC|nr:hypothetical protein [Ramlibacter sp.]HWI83205.1 hypothetical protein [Ramlibacter sp.]